MIVLHPAPRTLAGHGMVPLRQHGTIPAAWGHAYDSLRNVAFSPSALRGGGGFGGRIRKLSGSGTKQAADDKSQSGRKNIIGRTALLCLLLAVYSHNQLTRMSIVYAVNFAAGTGAADHREFINVALSFGTTQYALLASYAFTFLYAFASLPAGRVADTYDRPTTLAIAALVWSLAIAVQGSPWATFPLIWACRVVQGVAMAFTGPQAISLLAEAFPGPKLALATSIYSAGVYIGGSIASLSIMSNARLGWRVTFTIIGAIGAVLSLLVTALVRDPRTERQAAIQQKARQGASKEKSSKAASSSDIQAVSSGLEAIRRVLVVPGMSQVLVATAVRFCAGFGVGIWASPFFRAKFPAMQAQFAIVNALTIGLGGCISTMAGGAITERLVRKDKRAILMVPMAGCLLAIPAFLLAVTSQGFATSMFFFVLSFLVAECWIGPIMCVLSQEVPAEVRGVATSLIAMLTIFGNFAPLAIGQMVGRGVALQPALTIVVTAAYSLSAVLFYGASQAMWGRRAGEAKPS